MQIFLVKQLIFMSLNNFLRNFLSTLTFFRLFLFPSKLVRWEDSIFFFLSFCNTPNNTTIIEIDPESLAESGILDNTVILYSLN